MKFLLLAGLVVIIYRMINPPNNLTEGNTKESTDYTDYEEIE